MLLVPASRLALLFPWKCASQTLQTRLEGVGNRPYAKLFAFNPHLRKVVHQHLTLRDWSGLPESRLGYEVAAFVRNPYDRVFSGFGQLLRDLRNLPRLDHPEPWIRELVLEQVASLYLGISRAGFDVNRWFQNLSPHEVLDSGHSVCFNLHPASYWTHHADGTGIAFIGRLEQFEADFARCVARYGIPDAGSGDANRSPGALAAPDHRNYLYAHHLRPRTIAKINDLFREDFERLGYERLSPGSG